MSNWKQVSDFVNFSIKGITPKYVENSSIIVLNQKCIRNGKIDYSFSQYTDDTKQISESKFVKRGDILINSTGTGTAGRCAFVNELPENHRLITDSHILLLRCNSYYEAQCLSYLLFSFEKTLMSFMTGSSGQSELDKVVLLNLKTKLPTDSNIQQKIAKVLSDLDSKIELNNRINTELEAMAKTLYDYWFVQFDFPYSPPSEGCPQDGVGIGKPYKTSGGKMVWNDELKREIPEGWEVKKVKDIAETGSGGTPLKSKKEYFENGTIPWINSGEVNASFIISSRKFITQKGLDNSSAKLFQRGTILMAMYGATAGQVSLIDLEASTNQAVCGIIPNDKRMIPYLKYGLHQLYDYLINLSSGSARDNLSQDKIKELYFVIPEDNLMEQFYKISNSHFEMILRNLKENQEFSSLRDWLLPMLMNGQLRVGDGEEELGMVAEESPRYGK
ncbi:restriction endonuclease subunit S [Flavobacterium sp. GSP27]|uniref:restriction endonuclease subunit S n=1 Tax=unclassified Flavobacterium TaxID=196869 RepID=UPI000F82052B|nr:MULTISPECIES: restriction endonuclease subunit S [unclassified Flavobacterium]RTY83334.1 restriction endonuclease subunit S [Flavobacterium sp. ZB4P23]RTZ06140.1 restriction endonuclease subunit S [Flavobacterium sp. GSP27]